MSANGVSLVIVNRIVQGARSALAMTPQQCYPIIQRHYIEGFGMRAIQVVPGPVAYSGNGEGGQGGGMVERQFRYTLWAWWRYKADMKGMSIAIITQELQGFMDFIESIRKTFEFTTLGNNVLGDPTSGTPILGPMKYIGETETFWEDESKGVAYRGITFACNTAEVWPNVETLTDANFTS